jgi:Mor family transcriptional regulator
MKISKSTETRIRNEVKYKYQNKGSLTTNDLNKIAGKYNINKSVIKSFYKDIKNDNNIIFSNGKGREKNEMEKEASKKITNKTMLKIFDDHTKGLTKDTLTEKYSINVKELDRIIRNISIVKDYKSGDFSQTQLAVNYNISDQTIRKIIRDFYGGADKVPKNKHTRVPHDVDAIMADYDNGMSYNEIGAKYGITRKQAYNVIYHYNATHNKNNEKEAADNESTNNETKDKYQLPIVNSIDFANGTLVFNDTPLHKVIKYDNKIKIGMISGRHNMKEADINKYLFEGPISEDHIIDIEWQEKSINEFIDNNITFDDNGNSNEILEVYCTGLQVILSSIIKICGIRRVNLILMHYNITESMKSDAPSYFPQIVYDFTKNGINLNNDDYSISDKYGYTYPFSKIESQGDIYLYDVDPSELNNSEVYSISINTHCSDSDRFVKGKSKIIIVKDYDRIFEILPAAITIIQSNKDIDRNSILVAKIKIGDTDFEWGDHICKSFNYK